MKTYKNYSRIEKRSKDLGLPSVEVPNLLAMQIDSYEWFIQKDVHPQKRRSQGLQAVFEQIFPIADPKGFYHLEFLDFSVLKEKYSTDECIERNLSYQAPIKARMKLTVYDEEKWKLENEKVVKKIIEQDVFLGEIPLITPQGTFIVNGAERVIISQLHRSPGVFFTEEKHPSGKMIYQGKVIPYNGSWLEFSLDIHDTMYVHIDKRRKLPVTVLLRCVGLSGNEEIRDAFYEKETLPTKDALGRILYNDVIDQETGEEIGRAGVELSQELIEDIMESGTKKVDIVAENFDIHAKIIENTIAKDPTASEEEAVKKIYNLIRPGEDPSYDLAKQLVDRMFFNEKRYNLGEVGRYKLNSRLGLDIAPDTFVLTREDVVVIVEKLVRIFRGDGRERVDDIDHLSNRRIRTVGELLEEEYTSGLLRVARIAIERMSISNPEEVTVHDLINSNALIAVVNAFFLTGQLSQFMEQTNPLAALTHKRRLSALGPGGLTRERAGFDVRDVHYSHYGRICPVETPEGPNIGLISSPAIYSRVNRMGFLETPYIRVRDSKVTDDVDFLVPDVEDEFTIAQANVSINKNRELTDDLVFARRRGEFIQVPPAEVDYMDVSPQQIVSVSAALIPFLEHDDANRALMGSNMQRQAVPLLYPQSPVVGTGMEKTVAKDSGEVAKAPFDGTVNTVTASYIDIKPKTRDDLSLDLGTENRIYLKKYMRSNQDTCMNQRPIVKVGQKVKKGEAVSDGLCIEDGRFALGTNMLVAFMPWYGYNYEDAILLSERVAREDILTSIYIEEQEVLVRNVKNGKEELAYDIPNVPTTALRNLDKTGIIRVGSVIRTGDIIVGKITPKSVDIDPSPEENLMRALFGDRAGDFTNTSLKAKPGMEGVVIDVKVFSRLEDIRDYEEEKKDELQRLMGERENRIKRIEKYLKNQLSLCLVGQVARNISDEKTNMFFIQAGKKITKPDLKKINFKKLNLDYDLVADAEQNLRIYKDIILRAKVAREESENIYKKAKDRLKHGDELPYGVRKMVKVYIAKKRKVQVGDKMAGRHGNKGVISRISPIEDMPFMEDGTPVDIVLNPLGVPSRMNIGQILETHLGMAAKVLGFNAETPVFDGARIEDIHKEMKKAKLPIDGKQVLYDGKTGEAFKERVTVGIIYMMKLNHLVADKMHARSTGPYSLITQQPLGGKAQHGGQRLGEMEVWALEAYGAARLLEEMLTIKSDDVDGRTNAFKAITSGQNPPAPGVPESFNVLVSELKSLCFDIEFLSDDEV
ncbi:MAG: DNA-directed RNA polymerase subunit beta [Candidatus Cloacimonetes bacterium]|nr:DNA-directed RNA polymerase subunit beta [Candidatus Cloacimonadota bacterium]